MDDITYLHTLEESDGIELKQCGEKIPLSFYDSYSAMANGSGGVIYLGIVQDKPNNVITGVSNAKQKKTQLCNALTMKSKIANVRFESSDITIMNTVEGDVIKVNVRPVPIDERPVYLDGDPCNAFKRVEEGDKRLTEDEIKAMVNDSQKTKFDQKPNEYGFGIDDLDSHALDSYITMVKAVRKIPSVENMDVMDILSRVGAMVFDKEKKQMALTNGAALFLGKGYVVNSICPTLWLDYQEKPSLDARFSHRITSKDLEVEPNIFNFYSRAFQRLCETLPAPFYLEHGVNVGKRMVEETVREAFANALSNVELFSSLGLAAIKTPMSLSLRNAGGMLTGKEQALKGGVSIPRNPGIFNFFLAIGIADHGGYGVPAIFDAMAALQMARPILEESYNRDETTLLLQFAQVSSTLSNEEQKALLFISLHPEGIASSMLAEHLSCSKETARRILLRLIEQGQVKDNGKSNKGKLYYPTRV